MESNLLKTGIKKKGSIPAKVISIEVAVIVFSFEHLTTIPAIKTIAQSNA